MKTLDKDIQAMEALEKELVRTSVKRLRENDTTIHWTLAAMREFTKNLKEEGFFIDDLDTASQKLYDNLDATIHIRVFEYTGIDTSNFADLDEEADENRFNDTLVNDIMQAVFVGELTVQEGNFLLSNIDRLDIEKTRAKIDELIKPHFKKYTMSDEDFERMLDQLDEEEEDSSGLDFSNMDIGMKDRVMTTDSETGRKLRDSILDIVAPNKKTGAK